MVSGRIRPRNSGIILYGINPDECIRGRSYLTALDILHGPVDVHTRPIVDHTANSKCTICGTQIRLAAIRECAKAASQKRGVGECFSTPFDGGCTETCYLPSVLSLTCAEELDEPGTLEAREVVSEDGKGQESGVGHDEIRRVVL
jgi:hypothetical protein